MALSASRAVLHEDEFLFASPEALALVPHAVAVKYGVCARQIDGDALHLIVPEGSDDDLLDRVRAITGMRIVSREAPIEEIRRKIAAVYTSSSERLEDVPDDAPAIRAVDSVHDAAIRAGASDIHVEPDAEGGRVRLRIDGMLREYQAISQTLYASFVSRLKLLASMDIAERRQPQDGRYSLSRAGREFDARVSSIPTVAGERVVIRLLDLQVQVPTLESLGMSRAVLAEYRRIVHASAGFVVVCGPTGSGKTTTLYSSLAERNIPSQHVCSVEDPVEVRMNGIAQVQVNPKAGVTFAGAIRAFLRQDPNVIMLGEMRDSESATVAMSAALSGQLVVTTLHATDAPRAIERLAELGLSRQTLAIGLSAVVAQRLLRVLCENCKRAVNLTALDAHELCLAQGLPVFEAVGCASCQQTGYRGRTGIFELLVMSQSVRSAVAAHEPSWKLAECARAAGYEPLAVAAARRVSSGATSVAEARRVILAGVTA